MIRKAPHTTVVRSTQVPTIARLQIATGIGLLLFWAAFFTVGLAPANPPPGYFQFEHSFTVPDIILAVGLIIAGWCWLGTAPARVASAHTLSLLCAGALIFLGLLDISFNLQNGMYTGWWLDAVLAFAINAWCIGFGGFTAFAIGFRNSMPELGAERPR
jgi:hypothetical protein